MGGSLLLDAVGFQNTIWQKIHRQRFLIYWSKTEGKFYAEPWSTKILLKVLYITGFHMIPQAVMFTFTFSYAIWHPAQKHVFLKLVGILGICFVFCLTVAIGPVVFRTRHETAECLNELLAIHRKLVPPPEKYHIDKFGVVAYILAIYLATLPHITALTLAFVHLYFRIEIDIISTIIVAIFPEMDHQKLFWWWGYFIPLFAYSLLRLLEEVSINSFILNICIFIEAYRKYIFDALAKEPESSLELEKFIKLYKRMSVLNQHFGSFTEPIASFLIGFVYAGFITMALMYLIGYEVFPMTFRILTLSCLVTLGVVNLTFVSALTCDYSMTEDILHGWKLSTAKFPLRRKHFRKQLIALSPMGFSFGSFRKLDSDARQEYFDSLSCRTIDTLMLVKGMTTEYQS